MEVFALIVGHTLFPLIVSILNWIRIYYVTGYVQEVKKTFLMPIACSSAMAFIAYFSYMGMMTLVNQTLISLLISMFFAIFTYFILMIMTGTMTEKELLDLPMGGRLVKLVKEIGLLKE